MTRPNGSDMLLKPTKKVFTAPKFGKMSMISSHARTNDLISYIRTVETASDWLIGNLGAVVCKMRLFC